MRVEEVVADAGGTNKGEREKISERGKERREGGTRHETDPYPDILVGKPDSPQYSPGGSKDRGEGQHREGE